jgi:hypothetical protein
MDAIGAADTLPAGLASSCIGETLKPETCASSVAPATNEIRQRVDAILKDGSAAGYERFKTEFTRAIVAKKFTRACCELNLIDPDLSQAEWHALMDLMNKESVK